MLTVLLRLSALYAMKWGYDDLNRSRAGRMIRNQHGGHWPYLTIQGLVLAWVTVFLAFVSDFLPRFRAIKTIKRRLLMLSLPIATVVSSIYWTLVSTAPHLILPPVKRTSPEFSSAAPPKHVSIPLQTDLVVHLFPSLMLLFEFFCMETKYGGNELTRDAGIMTVLFSIWYCGLVEYLAPLNNHYPYPFLDASAPTRAGIYLVASVLGYLSFRGLNMLHRGPPLRRRVGYKDR